MPKKHYDFLIAGQGIAGSMLAWFLIKEGKKVLVVDNAPASSSSRVAAGIINPVTGRFVVKSWRAETLIPFAKSTYIELETVFRRKFFHQMPICRIFKSAEQREQWLKNSSKDEIQPFISEVYREDINPNIDAEFGGFVVKESGWVDTIEVLNGFREYFSARDAFMQSEMDYGDISFEGEEVKWRDISAGKLIFCEGYHATKNPWFNWLPFVPAKGEVLKIECQGLDEDYILNKGVYLVPLGNNKYKAGATFAWKFPDEKPTEGGKEELEGKLKKMLKVDFKILEHKAGIRPAVKDYRPLLGLHPEHPQLGIFNGMGTKGIFLSPLFAEQLVQHMVHSQILDMEVDIKRFWKQQ